MARSALSLGLTLAAAQRSAIDRVVRAYELDRREERELREDSLAEVADLLALGLAELR